MNISLECLMIEKITFIVKKNQQYLNFNIQFKTTYISDSRITYPTLLKKLVQFGFNIIFVRIRIGILI